MLNETLQKLNKTTLDCLDEVDRIGIVKKFTKTALDIFDADFGFMFWKLRGHNSYRLIYKSPKTPYNPDLPRKHGFNYKASTRKTPYFVSNPPEYLLKYMKCFFIVPIFYKKQQYGNIVLCYKSKRKLNPDERELSIALSNAAAQVLTIHELYFDLRNFKNRMDKSLDPVFILHPSSLAIEYANNGAQRKFGFTSKEFLKKNLFNLQPKSDKYDFKRKLLPLMFKRIELLSIETLLQIKNGNTIPVELLLQLTESLDKKYKLICTVHDLTEHKKAERELQKIMKQKDEFFNIASHELKTPVTTIKGYTEMLEHEIKNDSETSKKYLGKISSQTEKLTRLVNDLLDVSRIETGKMRFENENFELSESIGHAIENLRVAIPSNPISFKAYGKFLVRGDCERIERVLSNLVSNASKYSPVGSKINVCVTEKDGVAVVEVEDHGYGISIKDQSKIFKRFFQSKNITKENLPGLGLGLYIASAIVKHHGGIVSFRNKPKARGAIFYFTIPYYKHLDEDEK